MSSYKLVRRNGLPWYDFLLILGLILAPMTELRIWKIGPSELLCVLWSTRYVRYFFKEQLRHFLVRFWLFFYLTMTAGTIFCLLFYPRESAGAEGLMTWFFMFYVSLGVYAGLKRHSLLDIHRILESVCVGVAVWYLFLLIYSRTVSMHFLGARIWYARVRFSGGGANPHQMAILSLGLFFVSFYFLACVKLSRRKRIVHLVCMALDFLFLYLTRSTTAWMALFAAAGAGAVLLFLQGRAAPRSKQVSLLVIFLMGVVVLVFTAGLLYDRFYQWVAADPNGLHRFELFSYILDPIRKNFLFGLGDGTHSNGGISEFHNSYLEIIGMTGVIGVVLFIAFSVRLYRCLRREPFLLLSPLAFYIYGLAGFGMRRLPYWVITVALIVIAEKLPSPAEEGFRVRRREFARVSGEHADG